MLGRCTPLNISTHSASKREMLRWRFSPYWARITVHRRLVLVLMFAGAVAGLAVAAASPPVYSARVIISEEYDGFCYLPPPSLRVRLASQLDAAAVRAGLPNPKLEDVVSRWIDGRR